MAASKTYTLTQFAEALGRSERVTLDASLDLHKAYVKAADKAHPDKASEVQKKMRAEWVIAYVQGRLDVPFERASKIVAMSREERVAKNEDYEKAVNAAAQKFRYHVTRDGAKTGSGRNEAAPVRVSKVQRDAVGDLLECFDGETQKEKISAAIKALQALKARLA